MKRNPTIKLTDHDYLTIVDSQGNKYDISFRALTASGIEVEGNDFLVGVTPTTERGHSLLLLPVDKSIHID